MKKYLIFVFLLISFATNAQLKTPSKFVPNGTFATANATDISGANRVVFDTIMRNAIPYYLRDTLATMVYDITNNCLWRLSGGVSNLNWMKISLGNSTIDWSAITNKPSYATVATTGSYNDLSNKPNQLLNTNSTVSFNNLELTSLMVTGGIDYVNFKNPALRNGMLCIQDDGTLTFLDVDPEYIKNISSDVQAQLDSKQLRLNGYGFVKQNGTSTSYQTLATVATTGSYDDLSNKPTIPAAQVNADWNASSGVSQILNKPSFPSNVSSGNYTPTTGSWSNLDSFHIKECQYIRVGSIVTVSGMIECYPTAIGTITMGISLPVATNTDYNEKIAGTCASIEQPSTYPDAGSVSNEGSGSGRALISCVNTGGNNIKHIMFTFTYTITAAP